MSGAQSPTKRAVSPKKPVTRYGTVPEIAIKFGNEERFQWQKSQNSSDVVYDIPVLQPSKSIIFGNSLRAGMDDENPDAKKRSTGPGSYEFANCYDHLSEYQSTHANRFALAPRQSMAMKTPSPGAVFKILLIYTVSMSTTLASILVDMSETLTFMLLKCLKPSPGAVYNIERQYWNGKEKPEAITFPNSTRQSLYGTSLNANADLFFPRTERGPSITIAKRFKPKLLGANSPGAVKPSNLY